MCLVLSFQVVDYPYVHLRIERETSKYNNIQIINSILFVIQVPILFVCRGLYVSFKCVNYNIIVASRLVGASNRVFTHRLFRHKMASMWGLLSLNVIRSQASEANNTRQLCDRGLLTRSTDVDISPIYWHGRLVHHMMYTQIIQFIFTYHVTNLTRVASFHYITIYYFQVLLIKFEILFVLMYMSMSSIYTHVVNFVYTNIIFGLSKYVKVNQP